MELIKERIKEATEQVMSGADNSKDFDQYIKGMVRAFGEVLEIQPIILEENKDEVQ